MLTRRELLRTAVGSTALVPLVSTGISDLIAAGWPQTADALAARRAQLGATPITTARLADNMTLLSGPGGNVIVLNGSEGKLLVDSFVQPAWPKLKEALDAIGKAPVKMVIDTHWHFDHTDNNENLRKGGASVLSHVNTKKRMAETHDVMGMHFAPSPAGALPTRTFVDVNKMQMNGERVEAGRIPPAHTDTDAYVFFSHANVLHMGDVFFNGSYPFIDASTGGNISGQISGATLGLKLSDNNTKIVPGHGPVTDRKTLTAYHDMMATVRDRVQKMKAGGKKLDEVVAAKPTAEFDAVWGKGFLPANDFIAIVYSTVK